MGNIENTVNTNAKAVTIPHGVHQRMSMQKGRALNAGKTIQREENILI